MYWGAPSGANKWYKGASCDTPWNHDLLWRLRVVKEVHEMKNKEDGMDEESSPDYNQGVANRTWTDREVTLLRNGVRSHGVGNWDRILNDKRFCELGRTHTGQALQEKWKAIERHRVSAQRKTPAMYKSHLSMSASSPTMGRLSTPPRLSPISSNSNSRALKKLKALETSLMEESRSRNELSMGYEREREKLSQYKKDLARESQARRKAEKKAKMYEQLVKGFVSDSNGALNDSIDTFSSSHVKASGRNHSTYRSQSAQGTTRRCRDQESDLERRSRLSKRRERGTKDMTRLLRMAENGTVPPSPVLSGMGLKGL